MDYLARLVTPYLVNEVGTAAKKQQKEQSEQHRHARDPLSSTQDTPRRVQLSGRYYGIEDRRKSQDRRQQTVARGRWVESRTQRDRRKENRFKTII